MSLTNAQVQSLYIGYFGRPADPSGLKFWVAGNDLKAESNAFATSPEWKSSIIGLNTDQIVNLIYVNAFGHTADASGLLFWANAINTGKLSVGDAAWQIVTNTGPADTAILNSKVVAASAFTAAVAADATAIVDYSGSYAFSVANSWLDGVKTPATATSQIAVIPATIAQIETGPVTAVSLTTGTDFITGNNVSVQGITTTPDNLGTYTSGDQITPTGTLNSLTVNDNLNPNTGSYNGWGVWTPTTLPGTTVSNVQTVTFNSTETITADTANSTLGFSGLKQLNINSLSVGNNSDQITAASTTAVTVNDALTSGYYIDSYNPIVDATVTGGSKVVFNENNGTYITHSNPLHEQTIIIKGGSGTTNVTVNQTETGSGSSQYVKISDASQGAIGKAGTLTDVTLSGLKNTNNTNYNANTIASDVLTNLSITKSSNSTVNITNTLKNTNSATTLNLAVSGDSGLTVKDTQTTNPYDPGVYKVLNVTTGTAGSDVTLLNFNNVTTESITGSSVLTQTAGSLSPKLTAIDVSGDAGFISLTNLGESDHGAPTVFKNLTSITSTSTGLISVAIDAQKTSFTGGAGRDIVVISKDATKSISGGSASDNEIVLNRASNFFTQANTGANVQGFSTLGVSGQSSGIYALSGAAALFSGITAVDVLGDTAGLVTFTGAEAGTTLSFETGDSKAVVFKTADTTGVQDSLTINLGISEPAAAAFGSSLVLPTTAAITVSNLTVSDSTNVGIADLTINSYLKLPLAVGPLTGAFNTISALNDAALSSLTVNGTGGLNVYLGSSTPTINSSTLTLTDNSNSAWVGIQIRGTTNAANLMTLNLDGSNTNPLSGNGIAIDDLNLGTTSFTVNDTYASNAYIQKLESTAKLGTIVLDNSGSGLLTVSGVHDTDLTSLTLTGNVAYSSYVKNGTANPPTVHNILFPSLNDWGTNNVTNANITVDGATDNANVTFWTGVGHATTTGVDTITLGDGNNNIADTSLGVVNITLGAGSNTVYAYDNVVISGLSGLSGFQSGYDTITFGAHDVSQQDVVGVGFQADGVTDSLGRQTKQGFDAFGLPTDYSIITGLNSSQTSQDEILFAADTLAGKGIGVTNHLSNNFVNIVTAANPNSTNIADWFAAATAVSLANVHQVEAFAFGNATYLVETNVGTQTTVVELVGVNVTSASSFTALNAPTQTLGILHLLG